MTISRRAFVLASVVTPFAVRQRLDAQPGSFDTGISVIEKKLGGRIGVAALDTASGKRLAHRGDERFAMCSTFKWVLAAATYAKVERREATLDQRLSFSKADLLPNSPVTEKVVTAGALDVATLCKAVVEVSDNTGANLLLDLNGGPAGLTKFARALGDSVTRFDRKELALNSNTPGDPRDTTTPHAMVSTLTTVLTGNVLSADMRGRVIQSLKDCSTGLTRLRAGVPKDWVTGDKTGTGSRGAVNDLLIAWPPNRAPILVACYMSDSAATTETASAAHAEVARAVVTAIGLG
jgi:beta-lactamase class A